MRYALRLVSIGCVVLIVLGSVVPSHAGKIRRTKHLDYADSRGVDIPAPPSDKALVVFLRPKVAGNHSSLYDGEDFLGFVHQDTVFIYEAEPGGHEFMVLAETANFLDAELEAGKIYFVRAKAKGGTWKPRYIFVPVTPDTEDWEKLPGWLERAFRVEPNQSARHWYEAKKESVEAHRAKGLESGKRAEMASTDGVTSF